MTRDPLEDRIIDLEIRYTHQEELLQQLSDLIREQQAAIDTLQRAVERLAATRGGDEPGPVNEPPPHY